MMLANTTENLQIFAILVIISGVLWMALDAIRAIKRAEKKEIKVKNNDREKPG